METPPTDPSAAQPSPATNIAPPPSAPAPTIVIRTGSGPIMRMFAAAGWAIALICIVVIVVRNAKKEAYFDTTGGIQEKYHSLNGEATDKIAIINVSGVIGSGEGYVKHQIDLIRQDDDVKAVVLRINSPGGTITGSDYIYHHLTKLREDRGLPIVVSMGGLAASGGYYVAMAVGDEANTIFAEPTTTTGSIGVIIPHYDLSGLLERYDIRDDSIMSHPRKQMLSMTRPISDENRQILQNYVDEAFHRFTDIIKKGRPRFQKDEDALMQLATGEIFSANQALKHGLVDKIGFIEDAIERAVLLANLDKTEVRVVEYDPPSTLLDTLGVAKMSNPTFDTLTLLDMATPRAYYMMTSLPALAIGRAGRAD